jgi:hypothetical protein
LWLQQIATRNPVFVTNSTNSRELSSLENLLHRAAAAAEAAAALKGGAGPNQREGALILMLALHATAIFGQG